MRENPLHPNHLPLALTTFTYTVRPPPPPPPPLLSLLLLLFTGRGKSADDADKKGPSLPDYLLLFFFCYLCQYGAFIDDVVRGQRYLAASWEGGTNLNEGENFGPGWERKIGTNPDGIASMLATSILPCRSNLSDEMRRARIWHSGVGKCWVPLLLPSTSLSFFRIQRDNGVCLSHWCVCGKFCTRWKEKTHTWSAKRRKAKRIDILMEISAFFDRYLIYGNGVELRKSSHLADVFCLSMPEPILGFNDHLTDGTSCATDSRWWTWASFCHHSSCMVI